MRYHGKNYEFIFYIFQRCCIFSIIKFLLYFRSDSDSSMEVNAVAVESISAKLQEVTALAEQLDSALCGSDIPGTGSTALASPNINRILDGTAATTPEVQLLFI